MLVEPDHPRLSIARQCELLALNRSSYYYQSNRDESYNLHLMRLIDEQYTRTPFYGVPRMTAWLRRQGYEVNPKRIRRLMRIMGLEAIYPKPRLSNQHKEHRKYPYLLAGMAIHHVYQDAPRLSLSGGHHGLVQPLYSFLGAFNDVRRGILYCSTPQGTQQPWNPGDLQLGPGCPVYLQ